MKEPRFRSGFGYITQNQHPFAKTSRVPGTPGLPQFFRFWGNRCQTVVRGWAERENSPGERGTESSGNTQRRIKGKGEINPAFPEVSPVILSGQGSPRHRGNPGWQDSASHPWREFSAMRNAREKHLADLIEKSNFNLQNTFYNV